jgi:glycosyltransferase involved in cell wall biosynthesis
MRIAILTSDNRESFKTYDQPAPCMGIAPEALLQGFSALTKVADVEVHVVSCLQQPVAIPEQTVDNLHHHALHVPNLGWLRTGYQGCIRAVRKKLREIRPDLVHGQGTERDCAISAVFSGFPNVLTIHGNMRAIAELYAAPLGSFHWCAARLETVALKRAAGVFCNSAYTEKLVAPLAKKTWRVANALRAEFFAARPGKNPAAAPRLLNIGFAEPRKQQVELLEVARRLHERGLKFELQYVGQPAAQTAYGRRFAQRLAAAEKAGYARHLGVLSAGQVVAAMNAADALLHFPTEEAFGLVVAEALARNLKLFGAATGGVGEIAGGVDGAELFPATDFTALENSIADWIAGGCPQPQTAAATMRARYHPEVIARRHLEIYREVLAAA